VRKHWGGKKKNKINIGWIASLISMHSFDREELRQSENKYDVPEGSK